MLTVLMDENKVTGCEDDGGLFSNGFMADLLSLTALCGMASGATGLSRSTSCTRALRTGSLCLSLYFGYRPSNTVHSSSYTLVCTYRSEMQQRETVWIELWLGGRVWFSRECQDLPRACVKGKPRSSSARLQLSLSLR